MQAAMIEDRQSKTLLADETVQRLRAHRQRQWQKVAADFNKRLDEANERADASIAAWLAAHKERVGSARRPTVGPRRTTATPKARESLSLRRHD